MKNSKSLPLGHALCVGCEVDVDLAGELDGLLLAIGNERLLFFYCWRCAMRLANAGVAGRREALGTAFQKLVTGGEHARRLAVLTETALIEHDFDPVAAFEIGTSLPKDVHAAISQGRAALTKVGGMILVVGEEPNP